jgi:tRNA-specific 2-thiouridylase
VNASVDPGKISLVGGGRDKLPTGAIGLAWGWPGAEARGRLHTDVTRVEVKLRYRSPAVEATVTARAGGFELRLDEPAFGVAPGQTAVLYSDDAVVGAGVVTSATAD